MIEQIHILQEEQIKTPTSEANLWLAVIEQAIEDLSDPELREAALEWFTSTSHSPSSFCWICDHLDLNASAVWAALTRRQSPQNRRAGKAVVCDLASGRRRVIPQRNRHHRARLNIATVLQSQSGLTRTIPSRTVVRGGRPGRKLTAEFR